MDIGIAVARQSPPPRLFPVSMSSSTMQRLTTTWMLWYLDLVSQDSNSNSILWQLFVNISRAT